MGATASFGGAMIQAKSQRDAARRMMEAQQRAVAGYNPLTTLGPGVVSSPRRQAAMVNCKGCGAPHMDNHFCDYCGGGRPSIPRVKR